MNSIPVKFKCVVALTFLCACVFANSTNTFAEENVDWQKLLESLESLDRGKEAKAASLRASAANGEADAQYSLAIYLINHEPVLTGEIINLLELASTQGHSKALGELHSIYQLRKQHPDAYRVAFDASLMELAWGFYAIAHYNLHGLGVPRNFKKANAFINKAIDAGSKGAYRLKADLLANRSYVNGNETEALAYYYIAAALGDKDAANIRDQIENRLEAPEVVKAQSRAEAIYKPTD